MSSQQAINLDAPSSHPAVSSSLPLAQATASQFPEPHQQTDSPQHLDDAITLVEQTPAAAARGGGGGVGAARGAVVAGAAGIPAQYDLTALRHLRTNPNGALDDLTRAIDAMSHAVDATPEDHPDQARLLSTLGAWLRARAEMAAGAPHEMAGPGPGSAGAGAGAGTRAESEARTAASGEKREGVAHGAEVPEEETIYANTPQHHGTIQLVSMGEEPGAGLEALVISTDESGGAKI